jgi:hypothetical protein
MPKSLAPTDLQTAKTLLDSGNLVSFYGYLSSQGYGYANLASGVVECTTLSGGTTAQSFMMQAAAQQGVTLTAISVGKIEMGMATGYYNYLLASGAASGTDMSYQVALKLHTDVFAANGLGPQTWTLYAPSQMLTDAQLNANWNKSIDVNTSPTLSFLTGWLVDMQLNLTAAGTTGNTGAVANINTWVNDVTTSGIKNFLRHGDCYNKSRTSARRCPQS